MAKQETGVRVGVSIEQVIVNGFDVSESIIGIQTFEGIRDGFLEMDLIFDDNKSFIHSLDMRELNDVFVSFVEIVGENDPDPESFEFEMVVNSVDVYGKNLESNTSAFTMKCLSKSAILNEVRYVSRSFVGVNISTVVDRMLDLIEYEGDRDIETTAYPRDFIVPNLRPIDVIGWLIKHAVSGSRNIGDYVFYEDIDGIHFKTFNSLVDGKDPVRKYRIVSQSLDTTDTDLCISPQQIQIHKVQNIFDDISRNSEEIEVVKFNWETGVHIKELVDERRSTIDSDEVFNIPTVDSMKSSILVHDTGFYEAISEQDKPKFAKSIINQSRIRRTTASIELPGENLIKPGCLIEIENMDIVIEELDPVYSGIWLVDSVKRMITSQGYRIHAEIISDRIIEGEG